MRAFKTCTQLSRAQHCTTLDTYCVFFFHGVPIPDAVEFHVVFEPWGQSRERLARGDFLVPPVLGCGGLEMDIRCALSAVLPRGSKRYMFL
jgi:hypothetical protein